MVFVVFDQSWLIRFVLFDIFEGRRHSGAIIISLEVDITEVAGSNIENILVIMIIFVVLLFFLILLFVLLLLL
jgi:hypothetical protein